jgi:uncharacterized protein
MSDVPSVLYLHGFASSPASSKATYLNARLAEHGVEVQTPDLNLPDFSTLTITRMLDEVGNALDRWRNRRVVIIGSSLGGFVAVNAAVRFPGRIDKLVLLAPALDFGDKEMRQLGEMDVVDWQRAGSIDVFHYAYGRMMPVHYALYDDATRYNALDADLSMPVQVFQGRRDDTVNPATVETWSRKRSNVELHMLDDDHQLSRSLRYIWVELARFLDLVIS